MTCSYVYSGELVAALTAEKADRQAVEADLRAQLAALAAQVYEFTAYHRQAQVRVEMVLVLVSDKYCYVTSLDALPLLVMHAVLLRESMLVLSQITQEKFTCDCTYQKYFHFFDDYKY